MAVLDVRSGLLIRSAAAALGLLMLLGLPATAAPGENGSHPSRAIRLKPGVTELLLVPPGASLWYVAGFGGSPNPFALTAHYTPVDPQVPNPDLFLYVHAFVPPGSDDPEVRGDRTEWPGYQRLGAMSQARDASLGTLFWYTNSGRGRDFFIQVVNCTDRTFGLALTNHSDSSPLKRIEPPEPPPADRPEAPEPPEPEPTPEPGHVQVPQ